MCFYCILGLLLIFHMYICRILPIQLLGCYIKINACLVKIVRHRFNWAVLTSNIPVTGTKTNTEMIAFSKTYTETKTIKILNTNTV